MLKKTFCINQYAGSRCICVLKTNYEGAVVKDSNEAELGVVIRYDEGEVMAALGEKILLYSSVELLESLAARRAVLFTIELGFNQAIFEGNSEMVVKALNKEDLARSSIGHVIKDIKSMSSLLQIHSFYTKR